MKQGLLLLLLTHFVIVSAIAQTDYVVTLKGDTLKGTVKYLDYGVEKRVQLAAEGKKKAVFTILQVRGFKSKNEIYHTVRNATTYLFMKLEQDGNYLKLYSYQTESKGQWNGQYLLKKDGSGLEVPTINFRKNVIRFLNDCDNVVKSLEEREFTRSEINQIVNEYNACVEERSKSLEKETASKKPTESKIILWNELETAIRSQSPFDGRGDALEMIAEVRTKLINEEKIPNFLSEGLKNALASQPTLLELLNKALQGN